MSEYRKKPVVVEAQSVCPRVFIPSYIDSDPDAHVCTCDEPGGHQKPKTHHCPTCDVHWALKSEQGAQSVIAAQEPQPAPGSQPVTFTFPSGAQVTVPAMPDEPKGAPEPDAATAETRRVLDLLDQATRAVLGKRWALTGSEKRIISGFRRQAGLDVSTRELAYAEDREAEDVADGDAGPEA